jgi:ubiquinone/menaquinone biosynthesis C-methylase UbiE
LSFFIPGNNNFIDKKIHVKDPSGKDSNAAHRGEFLMMKLFRRFKDLGMEGSQARLYDANSREHRMDEIRRDAKELARHIHPGDSVLEIAMGPGYLSIEMAKLGSYAITGMDVSQDTVDIAARNAKEAGVDIVFLQGNASKMPFQAGSFHFIVCVLAFKNFKDPLGALNEMHRVLKPGGKARIMDLDRNASENYMAAFIRNMGLRGMGALLVRKIQKNGAYTRREFEHYISRSKFEDYSIHHTDMGFSIDLHKP